MVNLFRPKTMRRMAVFMALVAPIVYLFGSLFTALNGAHGQSVLADGETSFVDMNVNLDGVDYERVLYHPDGDYSISLPYTDGTYTVYVGSEKVYSLSQNPVYSGFVSSSNLDFDYYLTLRVVDTGVYYTSFLKDNQCMSLSAGNYWLIEFFGNTLYYTSGGAPVTTTGFIALSYAREPVSFTNLRSDNANINAVRKIPLVQPTVVVPGSVNQSDYIFGQFFAKGNFLVEWGRDAIGDNPHGFAPFGYFWRYLDSNVLHLSSEQVGLMAYGYMYYAAHVLLFDVGFMLVTFFLSFIQKVGDKIGGEER